MGPVLVVENGGGTSHRLAAGLTSSGCTVVGGASAKEALAALASRRPSAAFVRIPGLSARISTTCRELKADARLHQVPIMVCGEDVVSAEQAFAGGADDFFRDPRNAAELEARLDAAESRPLPIVRRLRTVLVVDDDALFRRSVSDALREEGYDVAEASSGDAALRLMETVSPALAIIDLFMPKLGGIELVQQLRASPRWRQLPVVAISGMRAAHDRGLAGTLDGLEIHDFVEKRGPALETLAAIADDLLRDDPARHRSARISASLLAEFRPASEKPWLSGLITNLGLGGAFVRTLVQPEVDHIIRLRIEAGEARPRIVCSARVVWTRPRTVAGGVTGFGVAFAELGDIDRETLRAMMVV